MKTLAPSDLDPGEIERKHVKSGRVAGFFLVAGLFALILALYLIG